MAEKWVTLYLGEYETLQCFSCDLLLVNQKVHLYLKDNDELDDVLCEACFRKMQGGE